MLVMPLLTLLGTRSGQESRSAVRMLMMSRGVSFAKPRMPTSSFTERAVAELSGGELMEDEVRMIRQGKITDPPESKLLALSDVFRVPRSYWYRPRRVPVLDEETERFLSGPSRLRALHMKLLDLPKERREQISDTIEELVDRARKQMKEEERRRHRADSSQGNT